jgi:RNA polymerase sigma factor (sigma-70 family)
LEELVGSMDDEHIERALAGDERAFRWLVDRYGPAAGRTARVLLADPGAAEDAVQEAWVDAWRHLPRFTLGRPFRPWLLTLVANRCRMAARRLAPATVALEAVDGGLLADPADVAGAAVGAAADAEIAAVLGALPPDQRRVVALRYFADLELTEIAAVTDAPLGTVKSRLHRALAALQHRFASRHTAGQGAPDPAPDSAPDPEGSGPHPALLVAPLRMEEPR